MTSEELRRIVLKQFYDQRTTEYFTPMHALVCEEAEGNLADICDQLAKGGLTENLASNGLVIAALGTLLRGGSAR